MKLKIVIVDLEVSPRLKRLVLRLGIPAMILGGAAVAYASVPHQFTAGSTLKAQDLNDNFSNLDTRLTALETFASCPPGYTKDAAINTFVDCKNGNDDVVLVGTGAASFWVDRFEASVWFDPGGAQAQYGAGASDDYPATFPDNGQWTTPVYAVSKKGVTPSTSITWFQASEACAASGKRLPTGPEWLRAARGTKDNAGCNVNTAAARATGAGTCVSAAGAEDMIGNIMEWTGEWYATVGTSSEFANWSALYNTDNTYNVSNVSKVFVNNLGATQTGLPAAAVRGGYFGDGTGAGVFAFRVQFAPAAWDVVFGFRCVLPR